MNRIVFLIHRLDAGGAQKIITYVANHYYSITGNPTYIISFVDTQRFIQPISEIKTETLGFVEESGHLSFLKAVKKLRAILIKNQIQTVCAFMPFQVKAAILATIGLGIKVVGSERDNPYRLSKQQLKINELFYNRCDIVVFQTDIARECFGEKVRRKAVVIPNPYIKTTEEIDFAKKRNNHIIGVGRLRKIKGFDYLIRAFSKLHKIHSEYSLHIYGEGEEREELQQMIKHYGLEDSIILHGVVKDVFNVESDASIFVLPSRDEGIPNVMIEAMAEGIPVIAFDCMPGGPRMLLDGGKYGQLVPVGDMEGLFNSMIKYIEDKQYASDVSIAAYRSLKRFDDEIIAGKWVEVLGGR